MTKTHLTFKVEVHTENKMHGSVCNSCNMAKGSRTIAP